MGMNLKSAFLMHKNIELARINVSNTDDIILEYVNKNAKEHIPLGGLTGQEIRGYKAWWDQRAVPPTRPGAELALKKLGYNSTKHMVINNLGLSLNDCYWLKPYDSDIRWEDINLFQNDFKDYFGSLSLDPSININMDTLDSFAPSATNGITPKKWMINPSGKRFLIKYSDDFDCQQAMNEVFATNVHSTQDFENYVKYQRISLKFMDETIGIACACESFCDENTELITAGDVLRTTRYPSGLSVIYPIREAIINMGLRAEEFDRQIDYQIMFDYLISNTDRHMSNIGFLRDPDTLKIKGMAPIYDNGNSMLIKSYYSYQTDPNKDVKVHSFEKTERLLLKHVKDRSVFNLDKVSNISFDAFKSTSGENFWAIDYLKNAFYLKVELLHSFQKGIDIWNNNKFPGIVVNKTIPHHHNNIMDTFAGQYASQKAHNNNADHKTNIPSKNNEHLK